METKFEHVSDTALMVAAARALETERADRLSADPFAKTVAGSRGEALLKEMPNSYWMAFGMGIRTKFIDEFLLFEMGTDTFDCVVNLGAGLDTRPWRLNLLPGLRWIEADFADVLDYKHSLLAGQAPHCRLESVSTDLNDAAGRRQIWSSVAGQKSILLTEGLLMYLPGETVRALAKEAHAAGVTTWILDFNSEALLKAAHGVGASKIQNLRAPTHLKANEIQTVLNENSWQLVDEKRYIRDGGRYAWARMQRDGLRPDPNAERVPEDDPGGAALYRKAFTE
jgi:methyltransferase (TIGR00027 family)